MGNEALDRKSAEHLCTVIAEDTVECITISRRDYERLFVTNVYEDMVAKRDFLHSVPYFADWGEAKLENFVDKFDLCRHARGAIVVNVGDPAEYIYFLKSGQCTAYLEGVALSLLGPGSVLGAADATGKQTLSWLRRALGHSEGVLKDKHSRVSTVTIVATSASEVLRRRLRRRRRR